MVIVNFGKSFDSASNERHGIGVVSMQEWPLALGERSVNSKVSERTWLNFAFHSRTG
jgi:hypothetical protein